jgi:hypothetical protein
MRIDLLKSILILYLLVTLNAGSEGATASEIVGEVGNDVCSNTDQRRLRAMRVLYSGGAAFARDQDGRE